MLALPLFSASAFVGDPFITFVGAVTLDPVAPSPDLDDWSGVPLETSNDDGLHWELAAEDTAIMGNQKHAELAGASSDVVSSALKNALQSSILAELGGNIPLEGEVPELRGKTQNSALAEAKELATRYVLAAPGKAKLSLLGKDMYSEKDLEKLERREKREKKKTGKLMLGRLKTQQRKKYDSTVELLEQNASRKRKRFKKLRKILSYIQSALEGG